jgi:NAD-dependent histone deacetylase SIR2
MEDNITSSVNTPPTMDSDSSLTELSSDLSSVGSLSPVLGYPSPDPSQDVDPTDDLSETTSKKHRLGEGEEPSKKKRKRPEPKPRTTQRLDLMADAAVSPSEQSSQLELLLKVLRKRRKIVVIAGAGISVSAGSMCPRAIERLQNC